MDFNDPNTWNDYGFNKEEDGWDVEPDKDKIWEEAFLVPPSRIPDDEPPIAPDDLFGLIHILVGIIAFYMILNLEIRNKVAECFSMDTPQTTLEKLKRYGEEDWAKDAILSFESLDPFILEVSLLFYPL